MTTVGILTWLYDPNVLLRLQGSVVIWLVILGFADRLVGLGVLHGKVVFLHLLGLSRLLLRWTRKWGKQLLLLFLSFLLLFLNFNFFLEFLVKLLEPFEFRVIESRLDVERQRQVIKHVLVHGLVVVFHVEVQCFFIIHMEVILDFVVKPDLGGLGSTLNYRRWQGILLLRLAVQQLSFLRRSSLLRCRMELSELAVLVAALFVRKLASHAVEDLLDFVLGPHKVERLEIVLISLDPPEPVFKQRPNHDRVVAFSNRVFVNNVVVRQGPLVVGGLGCIVRVLLDAADALAARSVAGLGFGGGVAARHRRVN